MIENQSEQRPFSYGNLQKTQQMLITIATLDAVTNAIKQGDQNRLNKISDFDFGSSVEFAAWAFSESESPIVHGLVTKFPTVAEASRLFQGGKPEPIGAFERSPNGLWPIRSREALDETSWELFLGRFTAALKREGFDRYNHALAEVLYEMTDNLIQSTQHAGLSERYKWRCRVSHQGQAHDLRCCGCWPWGTPHASMQPSPLCHRQWSRSP